MYCVYAAFVKCFKTAVTFGIILNACQCGAQLMIDTLVVERVHKETDDEGRGQSLAMASKTAGTVAATCISLILMLVGYTHSLLLVSLVFIVLTKYSFIWLEFLILLRLFLLSEFRIV